MVGVEPAGSPPHRRGARLRRVAPASSRSLPEVGAHLARRQNPADPGERRPDGAPRGAQRRSRGGRDLLAGAHLSGHGVGRLPPELRSTLREGPRAAHGRPALRRLLRIRQSPPGPAQSPLLRLDRQLYPTQATGSEDVLVDHWGRRGPGARGDRRGGAATLALVASIAVDEDRLTERGNAAIALLVRAAWLGLAHRTASPRAINSERRSGAWRSS
jgi:hypothetical protein